MCVNETIVKLKDFDRNQDLDLMRTIVSCIKNNTLLNFLYPLSKGYSSDEAYMLWGTDMMRSLNVHFDEDAGVISCLYETNYHPCDEAFIHALSRYPRMQVRSYFIANESQFAGESNLQCGNVTQYAIDLLEWVDDVKNRHNISERQVMANHVEYFEDFIKNLNCSPQLKVFLSQHSVPF